MKELLSLTKEQYDLGMGYSQIRYDESRLKKLNANKYSGEKSLETKKTQDHQGSISEVVVANYLGLKNFVPTFNKFNNEPDIEPWLEVRSRINDPKKSNSLLLRPSERPKFNRPFALVLFHCKDFKDYTNIKYQLMGYLKGEDAMKLPYRVFKGDPKKRTEDCYLIDTKYLKPMEELKRSYEKLIGQNLIEY